MERGKDSGPVAGGDWSLPLGLEPGQHDPLSPAAVRWWLVTFLAIGLVARVLRYLLNFPLWVDESFLAASLIDRDYRGLMKSLDYYQVCPLLLLWAQLTVVKLFGFSEYSLRAIPMIVGLGSLALFTHLARRLLRGTALVLAVGLFCVSYPCIRYAVEAKQYGIELFVSLVWLTLVVEWRFRPDRRCWLWLAAGWAPFAVGLSYTAIFIGGAVSAFLAWSIWSLGLRRAWIVWGVYTATLLGAFGLLFLFSVNHQAARSLDFLTNYWRDGFLPLTEPLKLPLWLLKNHTSEMLAYPVGGERGASILTAICWLTAIVVLWRRRQFSLLVLGLSPLVLMLGASAIHRYPYGQMPKFQFFLAPIFCMFAGLGAATLLVRRPRGARPAQTPLLACFAVLIAIGVATIARDFWSPAKSPSDMRARDFARWFWFTMPEQYEVVCLKSDLGRTFSPKSFEYGFSSMYLCNQRIQSKRHALGEPPHWDRVSAKRPLMCLDYRDSSCPVDREAKAAWLAEMQNDYELIGQDSYPFLIYDKHDRTLAARDHLDVYKFVPKKLPARALGPVTP